MGSFLDVSHRRRCLKSCYRAILHPSSSTHLVGAAISGAQRVDGVAARTAAAAAAAATCICLLLPRVFALAVPIVLGVFGLHDGVRGACRRRTYSSGRVGRRRRRQQYAVANMGAVARRIAHGQLTHL
jgi:hypothetical protein